MKLQPDKSEVQTITGYAVKQPITVVAGRRSITA